MNIVSNHAVCTKTKQTTNKVKIVVDVGAEISKMRFTSSGRPEERVLPCLVTI